MHFILNLFELSNVDKLNRMFNFRILQATLAASRSQLTRHMQDRPLTEKSGQLTSEAEREELKTALIAGQESAAVQILLEACLETEDDRTVAGQMWALREIRSVICSYLHQVFIADPSLAKLVHFQVLENLFIVLFANEYSSLFPLLFYNLNSHMFQI